MNGKTIDLQDIKEITNAIIEEYRFDDKSSKIVEASVKAIIKILDSKSIIHYEE